MKCNNNNNIVSLFLPHLLRWHPIKSGVIRLQHRQVVISLFWCRIACTLQRPLLGTSYMASSYSTSYLGCVVSTVADHQGLRANFLIWLTQLLSQEKISKMHSHVHHLGQIVTGRSCYLNQDWSAAAGAGSLWQLGIKRIVQD